MQIYKTFCKVINRKNKKWKKAKKQIYQDKIKIAYYGINKIIFVTKQY